MDLMELAVEQAGVFTRAQATAAGYSSWRVKRRVDSGAWVVVHPWVYAAASTALTSQSYLWAAYLAAGQGAVVSHLSAARFHGLDCVSAQPWVTVPPNRHVKLDGVRLVRAHIPTDDLDNVDVMILTDRERTIIDCLGVLPFNRALDLLDRSLQKKWTTVRALGIRTQQRRGRRGTTQLRRLLRYATTDARFEAERKLHRLLRGARITGWRGNAEIYGKTGELVAVADVLFSRLRLVIEVDGRAHHSSGFRFEADRRRQNALVAAGYTVLRFTWHDIVERPDYVLASIQDMIARLTDRP